jgi:hypothetical protein
MLTHNDLAQTTVSSIHQNAQRPVGLATAQTSNHDPAQRPKSTGRNNPCRASEPSHQPNSLSPNKFGTAHTTACSSTANHISAGRGNLSRAIDPFRRGRLLWSNGFGVVRASDCGTATGPTPTDHEASSISVSRDSPRTSPHSRVSWLDGGPALLTISRGGWRC